MHKFFYLRLGSAILALILGASLAADASGYRRPPNSVVYDCHLNTNGTRGWVSPRIIFFYEADGQRVQIIDGFIYHLIGHPIEGTVGHGAGGRLRFDWVENLTSDNNADVSVRYRSTMSASMSTVNVAAIVEGYNNHEDAFGSCQRH